MIYIAICDDNQKDTEYLFGGLKLFFMQHTNIAYEIDRYDTIELLNKHVHKYHMLFLDIQLGSENGIAYAKQLRKDGTDLPIILVSSSNDYLKEGYHVKALCYITKPYTHEELINEMNDIILEIIKQNAYVQLPQLPFDKLYIKNIVYIEVFQHTTELHTTFGNYRLRLSLKEWEALLVPYPFLKSSKSFLIHLAYVNKVNQTEVILHNDQECPLSRRYKKTFIEGYYRYLSEL